MELLTSTQKEAILDIIQKQCLGIQKYSAIENGYFQYLHDEDYDKKRRHDITAMVYAGFQEDTFIPGMAVKKQPYGLGMFVPELSSENAVIQLYSASANNNKTPNTKEVTTKCCQYNGVNSKKKFGIILFSVTRTGLLQWVCVITLNKEAKEELRTCICRHEALTTKLVS